MYSNFADLLPQEHPYIELHNDVKDTFGGANNVVMAISVEEGDVFTSDMASFFSGISFFLRLFSPTLRTDTDYSNFDNE